MSNTECKAFEEVVEDSNMDEKHSCPIGQSFQQTEDCTDDLFSKNEFTSSKFDNLVLDELDEKFTNDNLPQGWKKIYHKSGMPLYLHEESRVCSFAKPYFLGVHSLKNHEIPIENVPCLDYQKRLEKLRAVNNKDIIDFPTKLSHEQYRNYCSKVFKFKHIKLMRFNTWDKRREYIRLVKADRRRNDIPKSKDKTQLVTFPVQQANNKNNITPSKPNDDQWIINLNGKSYVSILHEYIQRVLKSQLSYDFKELENARFPYLATIILDGMQYGVGIGSSKKQAKLNAAKATLEILLPSVIDHITVNRRHAMNDCHGSVQCGEDSLFDELKIKDTRIPEFCALSSHTMPYDMLLTCVKKNFGEDVNVECTMENMQSGSNSKMFYRCTMTVNQHSATVICQNKREGRQKGAQALLQVLHPHISFFGSLLRLYSHQDFGNNSEKKLDEPGTRSPKPSDTEPNPDILRQLREAMSKLE